MVAQISDIMTKFFMEAYPDEDVPRIVQNSVPEEGDDVLYIEEDEDLSTVSCAGIKSVVFPPTSSDGGWTYADLLKLPNSIEYLYLNHDGVIYGTGSGQDRCKEITKDDVVRLFEHFKNLKGLQVCSYYSNFSDDVDIEEIAKEYGVEIVLLE